METPARLRAGLPALVFLLLLASLAGAQSAAAASYSERVLSRPELLSYWRLGETSGTTARDEKSARNGSYVNGVALNQPGALSGDPNTAARFDGIDDMVTLPTLPLSTNFTIEGWQKITDSSVANNTLYGGVSGPRIMPRPAGYYLDTVAGTRFILQGTTVTNVGVWVHWALVRAGATLTAYRNGVQVATRSDLPAATPTDLSGSIGRLVAAYAAKATIDDVSVYAGALTASDIAGDYAARTVAPGGEPPPPPPPSGPFYVDRNSTGGVCSDARSAAQAVAVSTPWCSVARAAAEASDQATILVRAATYPTTTVDGSVNGAMLTFKPYGSEHPVLDGLTISNSSFLRFQGFDITDVTDLSQATQIQIVGNDISPHDIRILSGSDILIEGNTIHDLTMDRDPVDGRCLPPRCGYGVRINSASNLTIRGNTFRHIPGDGIQSGYGTNYLIENNVFDDIAPFIDPTEHSDSIQFYSGSDHLTIRGNSFRRSRGPLLGDPGGTLPQRDLVIENNLLVNQRDWGVKLYNAPRLKLLNNTVWDSRSGIIIQDLLAIAEKTTGTALNNIVDFFQASAAMFTLEDYNLVGTGLRGGAHDISAAPTFVDPASLDYRLAGNSRGVDAGTSTGTPDHDQAGNVRVDTAGVPNTGGGTKPYYDLGALEFSGTATPPPPPPPPPPPAPPPPPPPTGSYSARVLALPGLLSYWRLGETSGTVAADAKGGRTGTYRNGIALGAAGAISGDANTAPTLDGVDDFVSLPALPSSVDFTIEGWQRLTATAVGNLGIYGGVGTVRFMGRPAGYYAGVYLGGSEYIVQGNSASNADAWIHWALVRQGSKLDVYRNGVRAGGRADLPAGTPADLNGSIGRIGAVTYPTKGRLDEIAVYSTALSAVEIGAHSAFGAG